LLAACGSRVDGEEIVASQSGGTVRLSPESLETLRSAGAAQARTGPQQATVEAGDVGTGAVAPVAAPAPGLRPSKTKEQASTTAAVPEAGRATSPRATRAAATESCPKQLETIKLGHVGTFSGVAGPLTGSAVKTMAAWAKDVNARGGVACHPVQVFTRDDGADTAKAAAIANELVKREGVVAFLGTLALMPAGFIQAIEKLKVPSVGGGIGEDSWFTNPWLYADSAHVDDLIVGLLRAGADRDKKKLGLLYCVEAPACGKVTKKVQAGASKAAGVELVYDAAVSVTQPDYTAQCLNAQKAGVDLLGLAVDGASMARIARSCASIGYKPLLTTASFLLGTAQSRDPTLRSFGVVTAAGSAPWFLKDQPGLTEYQRAMATWAPSVVLDGASITTWVSAKLFEAAIANMASKARGGAVTTGLIIDGLALVENDTLGGLTGPLNFADPAKRKAGNRCVFFQYLGADGWSAPRGSKPVCLRG
jgi:branched-chain amino acid transport system substrate-binding protein